MKKIMILFVALFLCAGTVHAFEMGDVDIHGFASTGYMKSSDYDYLVSSEDGSFEYNEAAINFTTTLTDKIRAGIQFYTFDLGDIGNNDVELDWAFLDYEWRDWMGVRVGKIKTPTGLYNEIQDYDMLHTSILVPQSVYNRYQRESIICIQGVDVYGDLSLSSAGSLHYDLFAGTMNIDNEGGMAKVIGWKGPELQTAEMDYIAGLGLKWKTPVKGLRLLSSIQQYELAYEMTAKADMGGYPINLEIETALPKGYTYWFSGEYQRGGLTVAAEYKLMKSTIHTTTDILETPMPVDVTSKSPFAYEGYYGLASYRFTDRFETGLYYSVFYYDKNDHDGSEQLARGDIFVDHQAWQKDLALSLRFDITDFWLVKLEAHYMDGTALAVQTEVPEDWDDETWTLFAVKTTFNF